MACVLRRALYAKLAVLILATLLLGGFYLRLLLGPVSFGFLPERVAVALESRIGPGWTVALRDAAVQLEDGSLALRATGLDIRNPQGALVLRAPHAIVSVDSFSLLSANLQARSVEFRDLQLRASLNRNGSLSFMPEDQDGPAAGPEPDAVAAPAEVPAPVAIDPAISPAASPVSVAVGSLFDLIVGPQGILGTLDVARVSNARLTVVDGDLRERATFQRVNATFQRTNAGGRRFDATLIGPRGAWELSGDAVSDAAGYHATVVTEDAPAQDLIVLSGLSALPASTDLKLSGRIDATFAQGRVRQLKGRLESRSGIIQIADEDTSPLHVDRTSIELVWDEDRRALVLPALELHGGDNHVRLGGELLMLAGDPGWRATLSGRDTTLAGAAAGDPPVQIDEVTAQLSGRDGVTIDAITLRGPSVSVDIAGRLAQPADPRAIHLDVYGAKTDVRSALRIWPEAVAPKVRRFLVKSLESGTVEAIALKVAMSGADIDKAVSGGPIPASSLWIDFTVNRAVLAISDGLPPLSRANVTGRINGLSADIHAPAAQVAMTDGRVLDASDGSFLLKDMWRDDGVADIGFRLKGGADGLGSLLQAPLIREIAGIDLDPSGMKGQADLRIQIPLAINDIPKVADLPLKVNGTVTDLSVEKLFGKDRLDGGKFTVAYDRGNLSIKGDGKIAGSPATVDVHRTREAGGEANVAFSLDDAARARRGLGFGQQLTGPVAVKASLPLGQPQQSGIRIEADLTKATVDQLFPGWTKAAGKPGKLSLVLVEGTPTEIRDLQLDSGSVQIRGSATLSADGDLDKAELPVVKLSPGDDMRAQIDRSGNAFKVTVRGNVGDARPFTKTIGSAPTTTSGRGGQGRPSKDFDLDLALNILTGHNDEAITNAVIKASVRKDNIRQLDLKGRLGSSNLMAQTLPMRASGGASILLQAEDAGALLRFLDVYRRMVGGELTIQMSAGDGPQNGTLTLRQFQLRNEPGLRRIIPTQSQVIAGTDANGNVQATRIDLNEVAFTKARMDFTRTSGRIDFQDAAIWGAQLGFTLSGFVDYARDRTDISGTFVPAYGLNNAFAQVPLFGPLLSGGRYEGLFAVNFRISGPATAPVLSVNPLSAVAPGFLRKLFGTGGAPETGSVPPAPQSIR
jgi:hypothetical protein